MTSTGYSVFDRLAFGNSPYGYNLGSAYGYGAHLGSPYGYGAYGMGSVSPWLMQQSPLVSNPFHSVYHSAHGPTSVFGIPSVTNASGVAVTTGSGITTSLGTFGPWGFQPSLATLMTSAAGPDGVKMPAIPKGVVSPIQRWHYQIEAAIKIADLSDTVDGDKNLRIARVYVARLMGDLAPEYRNQLTEAVDNFYRQAMPYSILSLVLGTATQVNQVSDSKKQEFIALQQQIMVKMIQTGEGGMSRSLFAGPVVASEDDMEEIQALEVQMHQLVDVLEYNVKREQLSAEDLARLHLYLHLFTELMVSGEVPPILRSTYANRVEMVVEAVQAQPSFIEQMMTVGRKDSMLDAVIRVVCAPLKMLETAGGSLTDPRVVELKALVAKLEGLIKNEVSPISSLFSLNQQYANPSWMGHVMF